MTAEPGLARNAL